MPLFGEPAPIRTGDASGIPHSPAHDLANVFLGNVVDGNLYLRFILAQEESALIFCLPAHIRVQV